MTLERAQLGAVPDYYYDLRTGDDGTGDGSSSNPWKTMEYAETQMSVGEILCRCNPMGTSTPPVLILEKTA